MASSSSSEPAATRFVDGSAREENAEVLYAIAPLSVIGGDAIAALKRRAEQNPRRRSRLCTHASPAASLHEMLIVHRRDVYVRPHRHIGKSESLHLIEGRASLIVFDDAGRPLAMHALGAHGSPGAAAFYYRIPERTWHGLLIRSDWLVFHETTEGPFDRARTEFPPWAPDGSDALAAARYLERLESAATAAADAAARITSAVARSTP